MKKLWLNIRLFFASMFRGMKSADEMMVTGSKKASGGDQAQEQKTESQSLYASLLRGEVTQEVKDLRYEMYESVRKSKEYDVIGYSGKAVKRNMLEREPRNIDVEDGLKVVLIQDNKIEFDGQNTSVDNEQVIRSTRVEADAKHRFKATHEYPVRHKIESFARKVVVKKVEPSPGTDSVDEGRMYKLDIYMSEYPVENDPRAVYVTKELESLYRSGSRTSDLTDLITLTFTTDRAYGDDDWKVYDFTVKQYVGIKKFDGNYILSFYATLPESGVLDVSDGYNDETSVMKFKDKTPRKKDAVSLSDAMDVIREREGKIDDAAVGKAAKKLMNKRKGDK